ncbi:hypothetical protein D8674_022037 [Pyrus ussuriensis x Pyrus communis]|uniref:Uncharacterized protein n=1 Tax=Pyrus ussuriensis x Pyrus communis TaxID=2448454 RepID=A0A5N5GIV8_9ROSA|nr:hypothetical protein D8674_022037 [Pyrus ussuriensis x Pyrus communis]
MTVYAIIQYYYLEKIADQNNCMYIITNKTKKLGSDSQYNFQYFKIFIGTPNFYNLKAKYTCKKCKMRFLKY